MDIIIDATGKTRFVYSDSLAGLLGEGEARTARASHVEPETGGWCANLGPVGGPRLGPFRLRDEALTAENKWLQDHGVPEPKPLDFNPSTSTITLSG